MTDAPRCPLEVAPEWYRRENAPLGSDTWYAIAPTLPHGRPTWRLVDRAHRYAPQGLYVAGERCYVGRDFLEAADAVWELADLQLRTRDLTGSRRALGWWLSSLCESESPCLRELGFLLLIG